MENQKVIVVPAYYEVHILPFDKETMIAQYYNGAGGIFEKRKNVFKNVDCALEYLCKKKYDDSVIIDSRLENEISEPASYLIGATFFDFGKENQAESV